VISVPRWLYEHVGGLFLVLLNIVAVWRIGRVVPVDVFLEVLLYVVGLYVSVFAYLAGRSQALQSRVMEDLDFAERLIKEYQEKLVILDMLDEEDQ